MLVRGRRAGRPCLCHRFGRGLLILWDGAGGQESFLLDYFFFIMSLFLLKSLFLQPKSVFIGGEFPSLSSYITCSDSQITSYISNSVALAVRYFIRFFFL